MVVIVQFWVSWLLFSLFKPSFSRVIFCSRLRVSSSSCFFSAATTSTSSTSSASLLMTDWALNYPPVSTNKCHIVSQLLRQILKTRVHSVWLASVLARPHLSQLLPINSEMLLQLNLQSIFSLTCLCSFEYWVHVCSETLHEEVASPSRNS